MYPAEIQKAEGYGSGELDSTIKTLSEFWQVFPCAFFWNGRRISQKSYSVYRVTVDMRQQFADAFPYSAHGLQEVRLLPVRELLLHYDNDLTHKRIRSTRAKLAAVLVKAGRGGEYQAPFCFPAPAVRGAMVSDGPQDCTL